MKFAIIEEGKVTEPVVVPSTLPSWATGAAAFLEKMYPGKSGWVEVPADTMAGATDNGDGTFTNPTDSQTPPNVWDAYGFKLRFTASERKDIRSATGTRIKSDDEVLNEAMLALVTAELLTDDRRKEILGIVE